jgi:flagellar hook-basal body complex protein FliE
MIEAVAAMSAALSDLASLAGEATAPTPSTLAPDAAETSAATPSFVDTLRNALAGVDSSITNANSSAQAFAAGDKNIPLSDVMVSMEQANLALQMASSVRDKVVSAYTNIMNMQV